MVVLLLGIVLGVLYVTAMVFALRGSMRGDEIVHYSQIHLFRHGDWRILDHYLTTIPGYHFAVAALLWISHLDSLAAARAINAGFGLAAVAIFHALRRRCWPGTESIAAAQLLVLPILAPLFFMVYTDVLSLALLLGATFATLSSRHGWSALMLCMAILVRQNDVLWAAFAAVLAAWPVLHKDGLVAMRDVVIRIAPYAVPICGFLLFWAWNGTISLSHDQAALHPLSLHPGNPFFALMIAGALLPLQSLGGLLEFAAVVRARPWLLILPPLLFASYWWGFRADNPYNSALPSFYPRNAFLIAVDHDLWVRAAAGIVMVIAVCGLACTRLRPRAGYWLYPFALLFLAASWLVEQRYVLVPLALWLVFREHRSRAIEYATLAIWLGLAVFLYCGIVEGRFFL